MLMKKNLGCIRFYFAILFDVFLRVNAAHQINKNVEMKRWEERKKINILIMYSEWVGVVEMNVFTIGTN